MTTGEQKKVITNIKITSKSKQIIVPSVLLLLMNSKWPHKTHSLLAGDLYHTKIRTTNEQINLEKLPYVEHMRFSTKFVQ